MISNFRKLLKTKLTGAAVVSIYGNSGTRSRIKQQFGSCPRISSLLLCCSFLLGGCASQEAYQGYLDGHKANAVAYYQAAGKPLVDITLPSPDPLNPYKIVVNREIKPLQTEQIKDSEWTGPMNGLISAAGMVGGIWAAGDAMKKVTDNSGHNSTVSSKDTTIHNEGEGTSASYTGDTTTTSTTTTTDTNVSSTAAK